MKPGDDVIVTFEDHEAQGVVISHLRGYVLATIATDPLWDYGSITSRMAPHSTVLVKEGCVSLATGHGLIESSTPTRKHNGQD